MTLHSYQSQSYHQMMKAHHPKEIMHKSTCIMYNIFPKKYQIVLKQTLIESSLYIDVSW